MDAPAREDLIRQAVRRIAERCPRLVANYFWAGTAAIALEETQHRESFDLDFHSRTALADTRLVLAEVQRAFPGAVELVQAPDAFGSGFSAVVRLDGGEQLTMQVFAAFDDVPDADLVQSTTAAPLRRVALHRYLADKVQCVVERIEARDLADLAAVLEARPRLVGVFQRAVARQDSLLMAERLLGWSDDAIRDDLRAYRDTDPDHAIMMRDRMLQMLRSNDDADAYADEGEDGGER